MTASPVEVARRLDDIDFVSALQVSDAQGRISRLDRPTLNQGRALRDLTDLNPETGGLISLIVWVASRQMGKSTTALAREFVYLWKARDPVSTLLATNYDSTNRVLWAKCRRFYDTLPPELRRPRRASNEKLLEYADTGARLRCVSSKSPAGVRSDTYQRVIADEFGHWYNAAALWADIQSCTHQGPHSQTVVMGTPSGPGTPFHEKVRAARKAFLAGDPSVRFRFWKWTEHDEYRRKAPPGWEPDQGEVDFGIQHGLDLDQIYWRHWMIHSPEKHLGVERFRREFPINVLEGFLTFEGGWFDTEYLNALSDGLTPSSAPLRIYHDPVPGRRYVAGIDSSWCSGGDNAVCTIVDEDAEVCAVLATNTGGELKFADDAAELCVSYNKARALCEWNPGGAGPNIIRRLDGFGIPLWQKPPTGKPKLGKTEHLHWTTGHGNKEEAYSHARQMVNSGRATPNDWALVKELLHIRDEGGTIEGRDGEGDDHAMSLVLALWNLRTLPAPVDDTAKWSRPRPKAVKDAWGLTR